MIKYERAGEKEFETVAGIIDDAYRDFVNPDSKKKDIHCRLMKSNYNVNIAKKEDKIVGTVIFGLIDNEKLGTYGFLSDLAVSKEYRKKGIGTELLKSAIRDLARMLGSSEKIIRTKIVSTDSHSITEKLGFEEDILWGRDDEIYVRLELPSWIGN